MCVGNFFLIVCSAYSKVKQYHIKFGDKQIFINREDVIENMVDISHNISNQEIYVRVSYENFSAWSNWVSADLPVINSALLIFTNLSIHPQFT